MEKNGMEKVLIMILMVIYIKKFIIIMGKKKFINYKIKMTIIKINS